MDKNHTREQKTPDSMSMPCIIFIRGRLELNMTYIKTCYIRIIRSVADLALQNSDDL